MMPAPGPIALRAIQEAEANVGVHEDGNSNWGKYVKIYLAAVGLYDPAPWCQAWATFRLLDAASDLHLKVPADYPRSGYTPTVANWAKEQELWIPNTPAGRMHIRRGDLCYFHFSKLRRIAHVGIVAHVHDWGVATIEGNTTDDTGVNRDGGGVYRKLRPWHQLGASGGFARIPF